jgi:DNA-binding CsgD family transcriptional regulator
MDREGLELTGNGSNGSSNGFDAHLDGKIPVKLTRREEEVLRRTSFGETNAQVAAALGLTVHAVKFHLASIFRKLNAHNRTEAVAFYLRHVEKRIS